MTRRGWDKPQRPKQRNLEPMVDMLLESLLRLLTIGRCRLQYMTTGRSIMVVVIGTLTGMLMRLNRLMKWLAMLRMPNNLVCRSPIIIQRRDPSLPLITVPRAMGRQHMDQQTMGPMRALGTSLLRRATTGIIWVLGFNLLRPATGAI